MRVIFSVFSVFFGFSVAQANTRVTENTDINKRDVTSHYQVTRCNGDNCKINSVTKFDKKTEGKKVSFGECVVAEQSNMRVSECKMSSKRKAPETKVIVKTKPAKKNRIQLHLGYGSDGMKVEEDNNASKIKEDRGVIVGAQYTRSFDNSLNLGVSVFSNSSATINFGIDY